MSVNNNINLLKYTMQKCDANPVLPEAIEPDMSIIFDICEESQIDICGNVSDEYIVEYMDNLQNVQNETNINLISQNVSVEPEAIQVSNLSATAEDIKSKIYAYRHPQITLSNLYRNKFNDICTMLNVTPEHSIKKKDLYSFTQVDAQEDANNDFVGALNRIFFDKKANDDITYKDMQLVFMRLAGTDCDVDKISDYQNLVNTYTNDIEAKYAAMSNSQRLDYAIEFVRDYFIASGSNVQLIALERLLGENTAYGTTSNTHQSEQEYSKGQFSIAEPIPGAAAQYYGWNTTAATFIDENGNSGNYTASVFYSDKDTADYDFGISIAPRYMSSYKLLTVAEILVHEITHASRFYFSKINTSTGDAYYPFVPSACGLEELRKRRLISDAEYNKYLNNWNSCTTQEKNKLYYQIDCYCGEYNARIQEVKYQDYYACDEFKSGYKQYSVNGAAAEEEVIRNEIVNGALYDLNEEYHPAGEKCAAPSDFSKYA